MNKQYIQSELEKRKITVSFYWTSMGTVLRFYTGKTGNQAYWNSLLPIDDESDARFVDFVEKNYKRITAVSGDWSAIHSDVCPECGEIYTSSGICVNCAGEVISPYR